MKTSQDHVVSVSLAWEPGQESPVGRLAWRRGRIFFEFDQTFLAAPLPISPFHLPARPGVFETQRDPFEGLPGVFADSLPDGWGRLLLDRRAAAHGLQPGALTPLDRLCCVGRAGIGALVYAPELIAHAPPREVDLTALSAEAQAVLEGRAHEVQEELLRLGGSPHGARPKVLVALRPADGHCVAGALPADHLPALVKFRARTDSPDAGLAELAWNRMARDAGVDVADSWAISGSGGIAWFAVRRFDREGEKRSHVQTLCGLLHADHRIGSLDYRGALVAVHRLTGDMRAVEQMVRRMAFNVLAHNRDDHTKQHSLRMDSQGQWTLAPAYDLTFSSGPGGEHSMSVGGSGRPKRADILRVAEESGVSRRRATQIVDEVVSVVTKWRKYAGDAGVGADSLRQMEPALRECLAP